MKLPKTNKSITPETSFGLGNVIGLIFLLIGILLVFSLMNLNLPINLKNFNVILQYGAALGSIVGGISMLLKKKEITSGIKIK